MAHCSKSSFFVQKFNFDFFGWKTRENVVVLDFLAVDNFDFTRTIVKKNSVKNLWKCCDFGLISCWKLWFHEKNCPKNLGEKLVKMLGFWTKIWLFEYCAKQPLTQKLDFLNSRNEVKKILKLRLFFSWLLWEKLLMRIFFFVAWKLWSHLLLHHISFVGRKS